jgi:hypothetical protein
LGGPLQRLPLLLQMRGLRADIAADGIWQTVIA